ncbi:sensor histidine kinase [Merdibacter massiliensis]|uniref:sensor histidine kinase n=1 Tax=Merdibacter massiliensis TaxID=1871030 RepID=UPI00096AA1DE|nr:HAMP domain-containing sensor histidine kinase [Merdibacter massiliensis]
MKRFGEFIRSLSLSQQLAAIIFFLISFFTAFFFVYLTGSVENVIREQMYTTLDTSQDMIVSLYGGEGNENFTQSQLRRALTNSQMHLIVDIQDVINGENDPKIQYISSESDVDLVREELSSNNALIQKMMEKGMQLYQTAPKKLQYEHGHMKIDGVEYCYSVRLMNDGTSNVLMSYMDENYAQDAKDMMINSILYITVMAFCFIFLIMMLWVVSLIHPLNQMRNYIEKVKAGKEAELHLNRKDEIGELAAALVSMREELLRQEKTKEEMIHNISHDLKTPIATIKSYGESIKDGIYPYETLEKSVDVIIDNADRLENKVHSLLYMNRVEYLISQDAEGVVTNMKEVVEKVLLNIAVIRNDIRIETDLEEIFFDGLWESWRVVVENILENALRYAQSIIVIHLNEEEGLTIANDGPSMDESRIDTLFKPYEKGEGGRFGLGLSIVSKVVKANHYQVRGENTADGVIFRIFRERKHTKPERKQKNIRGKNRRETKNDSKNEQKQEGSQATNEKE